ncbi:hypothetical protein EYF80_050968 [Liparis tanakae]|uniref:Uncharacterized protein n=1 Tax=Liparis tanakae TaxID=230148 RepID=A0A4Z2FDL3_9TELE|nr:hypothetical protein EYF80_050968 [Liparis tanakae]
MSVEERVNAAKFGPNLCASPSDGSPDESFGPGSSTGKKPGPQREKQEHIHTHNVSCYALVSLTESRWLSDSSDEARFRCKGYTNIIVHRGHFGA